MSTGRRAPRPGDRSDAPRQRQRPRPEQERRRRSPPRERKPRSDLWSRILIAVPAAVLAVALIDVGGTAWTVFMMLLGCACLQELYTMLDRWKPVPIVGFASLIAMCLAARYGSLRVVFEVLMGTVPVLFVAVIARGNLADATVSIAGTLLGVLWIGLAFSHAVLLRQLGDGKGILIDVAVGTFLGDTGAYLGGRLFGRRPLAPEISPNKTVEGLFCGMLVTILAVYVAASYQSSYLTGGDAFALGIAIAVLGPLGDLFESLVKRDAGAKDAGSLFGAHGGALDRLDGAIFTVVAGYYVWVTIHPALH
ncbi:MAG TPA: phosphatidate cytidylyltransferase [Solirubrobacteraceae bacterium]|nr:phosphatidate cytidylyltransferase [Solirubrobacteraceae bacterium]